MRLFSKTALILSALTICASVSPIVCSANAGMDYNVPTQKLPTAVKANLMRCVLFRNGFAYEWLNPSVIYQFAKPHLWTVDHLEIGDIDRMNGILETATYYQNWDAQRVYEHGKWSPWASGGQITVSLYRKRDGAHIGAGTGCSLTIMHKAIPPG